MNILELIKNAEKTFLSEADQVQINDWKIKAHEAISIKSLEQIEGVKLLLKWLEDEKVILKSQLMSKRDMDEMERVLTFKRIDWLDDVLGFFKGRDLDELKNQINNTL